jgi:hypothetical protein
MITRAREYGPGTVPDIDDKPRPTREFPVLGEWRITIDYFPLAHHEGMPGGRFVITQRDKHDHVSCYAETNFAAAERFIRNLLEYKVMP